MTVDEHVSPLQLPAIQKLKLLNKILRILVVGGVLLTGLRMQGGWDLAVSEVPLQFQASLK